MKDAGMKQVTAYGFTLIEVLLTVALIIAIAAVALPAPARFIFSQQASVVADEIAGDLRKAQGYSMAGKGGTLWGVALRDGRIVLFQGTSYADRDPAHDETYIVPARVDIVGLDEVVFAHPSGEPSVTPEISITWRDHTHNYAVNAEGVLEER